MNSNDGANAGQDGQRADADSGRMQPDFAGRVMRRLGYEQVADAHAARRIRIRRRTLRAAQAAVALGGCALGLIWWWSGPSAPPTEVAVGEALRGSFTQGAGQLDGLFAAMPRVPTTSVLRAANETTVAELPSASLETAPQLRSY